jgi:hypothetical protein
MPSSHFFFQKKKSKRGGQPPPMGWFGHPSIYLYIFFGFFLFFRIFFCFLRKNVMGHFGNNKVKWVKLPQFETLGGLSVTF